MLQHCLGRMLARFSLTYPANPDLSSTGPTFKAGDLQRHPREQKLPKPQFNASTLVFGRYHTDHMITMDWHIKEGWTKPQLLPFAPLPMHPFSSCLHYAIQCFEGLKAYRNEKGEVRLFRPECNMRRLKRSSIRLTLPDFDGQECIDLIKELIKVDHEWIPPFSEFSLYLRPFHIATDSNLGVKSPDKSKLLLLAGPVGPYYSTGFKPISLCCSEQSIRAAPNGTGSFKVGGNYGPTLSESSRVSVRGHQQVLWLYNDQINEVGSSNIFFVFKDSKSGQIEVATPTLEDLILPGVTRDSILELLRFEGQYKVSQRKITMSEFVERHAKGEVLECFGAGTAVIISGVNNIEYKGKNYHLPVPDSLGMGQISLKIRTAILDIQEGRREDKLGWVQRVL